MYFVYNNKSLIYVLYEILCLIYMEESFVITSYSIHYTKLYDIITVLPELLKSPFEASILKRAIESNLVEVHFHNLRDYTTDNYKSVDDTQFGGGAGMVMMIEPIDKCISALKARITSYNVCYTKLLRVRHQYPSRGLCSRVPLRLFPCHATSLPTQDRHQWFAFQHQTT